MDILKFYLDKKVKCVYHDGSSILAKEGILKKVADDCIELILISQNPELNNQPVVIFRRAIDKIEPVKDDDLK